MFLSRTKKKKLNKFLYTETMIIYYLYWNISSSLRATVIYRNLLLLI